MINISNISKRSIMIFNLGTPSASSLRGNSLSSQASQRSSPYLNVHPVNSKEPATIANVTIANLNIAHQKRSSLESPSAVNRAIAQITGGGGSPHTSNTGSYSSPVNGIHSSGSSPSQQASSSVSLPRPCTPWPWRASSRKQRPPSCSAA